MSDTTRPRLLVIGIDGADWLITRHLMDAGELPNLAALARDGAWGPARSTTPPTTPPAWTSIMTGKGPGRHGVFDFLPMAGDAMDSPIASRRRAMTLWRALSDSGLRVGTFNLPATYPPEPLSGFQVSGFDAAGYEPSMARPREAFKVLRDAVGDYELCPFTIQDPEGDRAALVQHADVPLLGTRALLREWPCDVYMTSFQIVDWVHHGHLGREMAPMRPETLPADGQVIEAYRLVDERVGALLAEWMGDDTTIIVLSDHGGTSADRLVNLEKLFLEHGLLAYASKSGGQAAELEGRRSRAASALRLWMGLKRALPPLARLMAPLARRMRGRLSTYQEDVAIDWSRTRAAPWGKYAQVRLNLLGRDAEGIVAPEDVPGLADDVTALLQSLRDPLSGEAIYTQVLRNEQLYDGPWGHLGPDLYGVPVQERYLTVSARSGMGMLPLIDVQPEPVVALDPGWGVHSSVGIIMLAGRGVNSGAEVESASVEDLTPTALHLLGRPVPRDMDGRVLLEALDGSVVGAEPETCGPWPEPERPEADSYSDTERDAVEQRLRSLGYM